MWIRKGEEEEEEVWMKGRSERRGNGKGERKVSEERGREGESHTLEFCQLESSGIRVKCNHQ